MSRVISKKQAVKHEAENTARRQTASGLTEHGPLRPEWMRQTTQTGYSLCP